MAVGAEAPRAATELLGELERLFRRGRRRDRELDALLPGARMRALGLAAAAGGTPRAVLAAALTFSGDILSGLWADRAWSREQVQDLVERIAGATALDVPLVEMTLYLRAAREQRLTELPPRLAIETQLRMLHAFAPVEGLSVWTRDSDGQLECLVAVSVDAESRRAREVARDVLEGRAHPSSGRARLHGIPVMRWGRPVAALVVRAAAEHRPHALALAQEAAGSLAPLLQLDQLLVRSTSRERALVASSERQLVRLGFDLHDGALQELAALAADIRLFRSQLDEAFSGEHREVLLGRIDDLEARVVGIDSELRELTRSLEAPATVAGSLTEVVEAELAGFRKDAGIEVELDVRGELDDLTASQSIALTRIVQEALTNAREHSGATHVAVTLVGTKALLQVEIRDDGAGFPVEERVVEAARAGHLGLVGMAERARLLGGRLEVDSRPGGPTRVTARIPRWRPSSEQDAVARGATPA